MIFDQKVKRLKFSIFGKVKGGLLTNTNQYKRVAKISESQKAMALALPDDVWTHIGLHLKPRHLSKLMRTCKRINRLVDNETYWTRVVVQLALRDNIMFELSPPCGETLEPPEYLPSLDPSLYHMVGLERGYYDGMQRYIERISPMIDVQILVDEVFGREYYNKMKGLSLREFTLECAKEIWDLDGDDMKAFAKTASIKYWDAKKKKFKDQWPKIQKFLIDMEDDPMPAVYKRRFFRKMFDAFGYGDLYTYCGTHGDCKLESIDLSFFIF